MRFVLFFFFCGPQGITNENCQRSVASLASRWDGAVGGKDKGQSEGKRKSALQWWYFFMDIEDFPFLQVSLSLLLSTDRWGDIPRDLSAV